jgi:hypothetical protein
MDARSHDVQDVVDTILTQIRGTRHRRVGPPEAREGPRFSLLNVRQSSV